MSDSERPRDTHRDRREPRGGRDRDNERPSHTERRNRSRSPRGGDRGGRRDGGRYRSRSPFRRDERDNERGRNDRGRGGRDTRNDRGPPSGPRSQPRGAPTPAPRAAPKAIKPESASPEPHDVPMGEARQRPEDVDDETWAVMQTMGFSGFKSTKNTKVPGNDRNFGIRREKQLQARQYMNRQGGFNRPLSPGRG